MRWQESENSVRYLNDLKTLEGHFWKRVNSGGFPVYLSLLHWLQQQDKGYCGVKPMVSFIQFENYPCNTTSETKSNPIGFNCYYQTMLRNWTISLHISCYIRLTWQGNCVNYFNFLYLFSHNIFSNYLRNCHSTMLPSVVAQTIVLTLVFNFRC